MKGNIAVLSLLGLFLVMAIWISIWMPEIAAEKATMSSRSWAAFTPPPSPWAEAETALADANGAVLAFGKNVPKDKGAVLAKAKKDHEAKVGGYVTRGGKLYATYCAHCHGDKGDGKGEAAAWLPVGPRDLVRGIYRFRTTSADINPSDADLFRTISVGSFGSPMPGFGQLLSPDDRWALVAYLKTLSKRWTKPSRILRKNLAKRWIDIESVLGPQPRDLDALGAKLVVDPKTKKTTKETRAQKLYRINCANCHGDKGYGDGPNADEQYDESFDPKVKIFPRNFHRGDQFKRGNSVRDIAYTVVTGIAGTGMPSHTSQLNGNYESSSLTRMEAWIVAQYVANFSKDAPVPRRNRWKDMGARLAPDETFYLRARAWHFEKMVDASKDAWAPLGELKVKQGQIVRIVFRTYDDGKGDGQGIAITGYEHVARAANILVADQLIQMTFKAEKAGSFSFYNPTQSAPGNVLSRMRGTLTVEPSN